MRRLNSKCLVDKITAIFLPVIPHLLLHSHENNWIGSLSIMNTTSTFPRKNCSVHITQEVQHRTELIRDENFTMRINLAGE